MTLSQWEKFEIGGSMESLVEMVQIEISLRNYVNFTLWNGFSWAFRILKPRAPGGPAPWTPGATMESPMKIVQIDNSVQNCMWILPPILILPTKIGFLGLLNSKTNELLGAEPLDPRHQGCGISNIESPVKMVQIENSLQNNMWILPSILNPHKRVFLGFWIAKTHELPGAEPPDPYQGMESPVDIVHGMRIYCDITSNQS